MALVFLPAADIPTFVGEGRVDLGITGRDQVAEHEATSPSTEHTGVEEVLDLGFGKCSLKVQVPEKGEISDPASLIGKNVVTSFVGLTKQYFARLEKEDDEKVGKEGWQVELRPANGQLRTKIKYVGGSVEAACALGVADGIVDLVGQYLIDQLWPSNRLTGYRIRRNNESCRPQSHRHSRIQHSSPDQIEKPIQPGIS